MLENFSQLDSSALTYAHSRDWAISAIDLSQYPALQKAWTESKQRMQQIAALLADNSIDDRIVTVALSGSLGRMEGHPRSDGDLIVIVREMGELKRGEQRELVDRIWTFLEPLQIERPASDGIFVNATDSKSLCDTSSLGLIDESTQVFGTRMQLLLDSQPVYSPSGFRNLVQRIIERYTFGSRLELAGSEWACLINDLIRYYRCLALDAQWRRRDEMMQWQLFNLKFAFSRRVLYLGLLLLVAQANLLPEDRRKWLGRYHCLTPLERIAYVMLENDAAEQSVDQLLRHYDLFLDRIQDQAFRANLDTDAVADDDPSQNSDFTTLMAHSQQLAELLWDFIHTRRNVWPASVLTSFAL